eukprot:TRINITY_DN12988_c0_g1_i1.p1 TRINITY_DN12988_c0_g1~~TRINITY_DN12988_c0_g1_i1.p1  ORF type:complete len:193 (-),score=39.01 TRINITY_DN12988_c0_g1_i1:33-611(-)
MEHTQNTALLIMDVQPNILKILKDSGALLINSINVAVAAARKANILIVFVVMALRKGYPDVNSNNKAISEIVKSGFPDFTQNLHADHSVNRQEDDILVFKKRGSAFSGSDLEVILRSRKIERLVLAGIQTSGVVLSTLIEAAYKDYALTVLSDCCFEFDDEVQRVLMEKIFVRQADVIKAEDWANTLTKKEQ